MQRLDIYLLTFYSLPVMQNKPGSKLDCKQLKAGDEFSTASHKLDASLVSAYIRAVEESSDIYRSGELVPPTAIATFAIVALFETISLPPGTVHVSQELDFVDKANVGDTITCNARVLRKQDRGGMNLMTIGLDVYNQSQKKVLAGRTSVVLP